MDPHLATLIQDASAASSSAADARGAALPAAIRACRAIERAVIEMLDGEPMRGLRNIGISGETWYGARVRTHPDTKVDHFNDCLLIEEEGRSSDAFLYIDRDGSLRILRWAFDAKSSYWTLESFPVADDYLQTKDPAGMARALLVVLPRHIRQSHQTARSYSKAKELATRLTGAVR